MHSLAKIISKTILKPVSTIVGVSPAVSVFDSIKVIFPGMSISNKCICRHKSKDTKYKPIKNNSKENQVQNNQEQDVLRTII